MQQVTAGFTLIVFTGVLPSGYLHGYGLDLFTIKGLFRRSLDYADAPVGIGYYFVSSYGAVTPIFLCRCLSPAGYASFILCILLFWSFVNVCVIYYVSSYDCV